MFTSMITIELFIVLAFCICGACWTSWKSGMRRGIETTLDQLESAGIIEFDSE